MPHDTVTFPHLVRFYKKIVSKDHLGQNHFVKKMKKGANSRLIKAGNVDDLDSFVFGCPPSRKSWGSPRLTYFAHLNLTAIQTGVNPSIVRIWFIFEHYVWKCHSEQSTIPVDRYIALQTMWAQRRLHQNAPSLAVLQVPISVKLWIRQNSSVDSVYSGQISSPRQSKYVSHLR